MFLLGIARVLLYFFIIRLCRLKKDETRPENIRQRDMRC